MYGAPEGVQQAKNCLTEYSEMDRPSIHLLPLRGRGGSRLSRMFQASFSPATIPSSTWVTLRRSQDREYM